MAGGLGPPAEHALISLLALNGLRVSEATAAALFQVSCRNVSRQDRLTPLIVRTVAVTQL
jgi:hypothetical protein